MTNYETQKVVLKNSTNTQASYKRLKLFDFQLKTAF